MADAILDVQGLETQFKTSNGTVHAVNGVAGALFYVKNFCGKLNLA